MGGCVSQETMNSSNSGKLKPVKVFKSLSPRKTPPKKKTPTVKEVNCPYNFVPAKNIYEDARLIFTIERILGKGISSQVCSVIRKSDGKRFACKILKRNYRWSGLLFETEYKILTKLKHKGIISLKDVYVDRKYLYLLCEEGTKDLFNCIKNKDGFREDEAKKIILNILQSVRYMQTMNLVHRDLKPENIVFTKDNYYQSKIIDFGDAICVDPKQTYSEFVGTPCYLAPERLRQHTGKELMKSDVWAIGIIAYEMVVSKRCFYGKTQGQIFQKIKDNIWHWPRELNSKLSDSFKDFIEKLLVPDPSLRVSAQQAMKHPWLSDAFPSRKSNCSTSRVSLSDMNCVLCSIFDHLAGKSSISNRLQELLVVSQIAKMTQQDNLETLQMFRRLDHNHDGYITINDLIDTFLKDGLSIPQAVTFARTILNELDLNGNKRVDFAEFQRSHVACNLSVSIDDEFDAIDREGKQYLTEKDLQTRFSVLLHEKEIIALVNEIDTDGDGRVTLDEFRAAVQSSTPPISKLRVSVSME